MVTDEMLKAAAIEAENALISMAPESGETHEFSKRFEKKIQNLTKRVRNPVGYYAKRAIPAMVCVLAILIGSFFVKDAPDIQYGKYKRISFDQETLGESLAEHIDSNTVVINNVKAEFPSQIPIYKIKESKFSEKEFTQIQKDVKAAWETAPNGATPSGWEMEGNEIHGYFALEDEEPFTMTEEELEEIAWEAFRKLPFAEGEYEYSGIRGRSTTSYVDGRPDVLNRVMVSFYPLLDGLRVIGDNRCDMWFEDTGLVEIHLKRYEYEPIGTMDVVPLKDAEARIKTPDVFVMEEGTGTAQKLQVEKVALLLVNQHSDGCTILQPLYNFMGVATTEEKGKTDFQSRIIAIPESYTYEAK